MHSVPYVLPDENIDQRVYQRTEIDQGTGQNTGQIPYRVLRFRGIVTFERVEQVPETEGKVQNCVRPQHQTQNPQNLPPVLCFMSHGHAVIEGFPRGYEETQKNRGG